MADRTRGEACRAASARAGKCGISPYLIQPDRRLHMLETAVPRSRASSRSCLGFIAYGLLHDFAPWLLSFLAFPQQAVPMFFWVVASLEFGIGKSNPRHLGTDLTSACAYRGHPLSCTFGILSRDHQNPSGLSAWTSFYDPRPGWPTAPRAATGCERQ